MSNLIQLIFNGLSMSGILMLATLGIVLIFRTSMTTNFAQGIFGTFAAALFARMIPVITSLIPGLPFYGYFIITMLIAFLATALLGVLIDVLLIRKAKRINPVGKQMITMGLVLVFTGLIPLVFGTKIKGFGQILQLTESNKHLFTFGSVVLQPYRVVTILISFVVIAIVLLMLRYTKWGLGVRATASNEMVAGMMGVNTHFITAITWGVAGGLSALSAILLAQGNVEVTVSLMADIQIYAFLAAILGGLATFYGPLVGALLIPIATSLTSYYLPSEWYKVIVYAIILIVVLIKPNGLFGKSQVKKV